MWTNETGQVYVESLLNLLRSAFDIITAITKAFTNAWNSSAGFEMITAIYEALTKVHDLLASIGDSFSRVFSNGIGVEIWTNILGIVTGVWYVVGNLAESLQQAWDTAGLGDSIWQGILSIVNNVLEHIHNIVDSTAEWVSNIDFSPLLSSLSTVLDVLNNLVDIILDGLAWAWENILEPFGKWTIEEGIPAVLDAISVALELISAMAEKAAPWLKKIWDNFLEPVADFVGDAFVSFFETLGQVLSDIANNETAVSILTGIAAAIGLIVAAITAWNVVQAILNALLTANPIGLIVMAIAAVIAAIVLCITYWDEIKAAMQSVWEKIVEVFGGLGDWFSEKWETVKAATSDTWNEIKSTISDIWDGIVTTIKDSVNSVIGFINGMISGIVAGINTIINALNSLHFDIPDWIPAIGGKSFGFSIPTITAPQIPYLATGAVIPPNAPFMAVLGDQKHGTNIEAPLSLIEDAVNRAVRNAMGNQQRGGTYIFEAQLDRRTIFRQVIEEAKLRQTVTGRNPFELA